MVNLDNLEQFLSSITGNDLISWFFKAFAILLSFMFLLYSIMVYRQTQVMNKTVTRQSGPLLLAISGFQLILAILLIYLAIFVL